MTYPAMAILLRPSTIPHNTTLTNKSTGHLLLQLYPGTMLSLLHRRHVPYWMVIPAAFVLSSTPFYYTFLPLAAHKTIRIIYCRTTKTQLVLLCACTTLRCAAIANGNKARIAISVCCKVRWNSTKNRWKSFSLGDLACLARPSRCSSCHFVRM